MPMKDILTRNSNL